MTLFTVTAALRSAQMGTPWGPVLRALRLQRQRETGERWPKKRVADLAGMTATTYGKIEAGGHTTTRQMQDLARVYNVPIQTLFLPVTELSDSPSGKPLRSSNASVITTAELETVGAAALTGEHGGSRRVPQSNIESIVAAALIQIGSAYIRDAALASGHGTEASQDGGEDQSHPKHHARRRATDHRRQDH